MATNRAPGIAPIEVRKIAITRSRTFGAQLAGSSHRMSDGCSPASVSGLHPNTSSFASVFRLVMLITLVLSWIRNRSRSSSPSGNRNRRAPRYAIPACFIEAATNTTSAAGCINGPSTLAARMPAKVVVLAPLRAIETAPSPGESNSFSTRRCHGITLNGRPAASPCVTWRPSR